MLSRRLASPAWQSGLDRAARWAVPAAVILFTALQLRLDPEMFPEWIGWSDQGRYLRAALAWAHGNFDPGAHHYPPGYTLLAAPFVHLTPAQPFLLPDLLCSGAALVLFTRVARRMAPDMRHVDLVSAACFLLAAAGFNRALCHWVVPWTTTLAAPLLIAIILFALRYGERRDARDAACLGTAAGLCAIVRPTDAAVALIACAAYGAIVLARTRPGLIVAARHAVLLGGFLLLGLLPGIVAHLLVHGFSAGDYIGGSAAVGFDWRLIPLRWVTLAIGPRPLFPQGTGMMTVFWWLLPGVAGMGLASARGGAAPANRLVAATVIIYWLLYLSYRDLHSYGLWRFNNVHYFKWTWPFLAFWAVLLARAAWAPASRRGAAVALGLAILLFCWRPVFVPEAHGVENTDGVHAAIPGGLSSVSRVFKMPADGDWRQIYFDLGMLTLGGQRFSGVGYFKLFPAGTGFMLMPLRRLPEGDAELTVPDGVRLPAQAAWQSGRVRLAFGIPCAVTPRLGDCKPLPGTARHPVGE